MPLLLKHCGNMQYKKTIQYGLVLAANFVLFYLLYRWYQNNIYWHEFTNALQMVPRSGVMAALVLGMGILVLYGQRLAYLLNQKTTGSFWPSFWIMSYGFGTNNIVPFRIGDALKIYFAKKYFNISATRLLLIKVMEKFFDLVALLIIGAWVVIIGSIAINKTHLLVIAAALALLFFGVLITAALTRRNIAWVAKLRQYEKINHIITMFETVIADPALKKFLGMTVCIWAMTIGTMFIYYTLVLPSIEIRLVDILALVFLTTLSLGIPSVPGALGLFEAAIVFYLNTFLEIPAAYALACALVLHLVQAGPQIILMLAAILAGKWQQKNRIAALP